MWQSTPVVNDTSGVTHACDFLFCSAVSLRTSPPIQMRVVRHTWFIICVLCVGAFLVGALEAVAAHYVEPWWLQIPTNVAISVVAFITGSGIFASSHEWVLRDPKLEPPLWALDICIVS